MRPLPADNDRGRGTEIGAKQVEATEWAYQLFCECGYKVRCEVIRHGQQLGQLTFFDDEEASATRGEQIWYCPGCQNRLDLLSFRPLV
jgi:hypothetical protein